MISEQAEIQAEIPEPGLDVALFAWMNKMDSIHFPNPFPNFFILTHILNSCFLAIF
jgi:hypothetical protein